MTLKEFYDNAKVYGCEANSPICVERAHLNGFFDETTIFYEPDKFVIDPVILESDHHMTLEEFYNECVKYGCDDDTEITIFYCDIDGFKVEEINGEKIIFID